MPPPCCAVHVTAGQLKNQTVLPLPPISDAELEARPVPADVQRLLEAALVTWTRQIKAVLSQEPEQAANSADGAQAGPLAELDYWADRATQLGGIWQQLGQPSMQRAVAALEAGASTYLPAFVRLCHEVDAAHRVAAESSRYLQPLRKPLDRLHTMDDFPALASLFKPILHTLLLIWQHSQHYSSAPRLVSLIRHICNDLIAQARRFCPGPELMHQEPQEAAEKLRLVLKVLGTFKSYFLEYKARSMAQVPSNPWRVQSGALFGRLDAFLARCQDVLDLCRTRQEVCLGGPGVVLVYVLIVGQTS